MAPRPPKPPPSQFCSHLSSHEDTPTQELLQPYLEYETWLRKAFAFDGSQVYTNPRGMAAIATRTNMIDLTRRSPSYETRLRKYRYQGFEAYWDALERSRLREDLANETNPKIPTGLARLIYWERVTKYRDDYSANMYRTCRSKRINSCGDPAAATDDKSGYPTHEVPYGWCYIL